MNIVAKEYLFLNQKKPKTLTTASAARMHVNNKAYSVPQYPDVLGAV